MKTFSLRASHGDLVTAAGQYDASEDKKVLAVGKAAARTGYLTRDQLLVLVRWKSPRASSRAAANRPEFVAEVTRTSLQTRDEQLRIEVLTLLRGVGWPTASVILHFCIPDRYPILDVRALWTLGLDEVPGYDFEFWQSYTSYCRSLASEMGLSMRSLDRGLWEYSRQAGEAADPR